MLMCYWFIVVVAQTLSACVGNGRQSSHRNDGERIASHVLLGRLSM
jgi:hypothetical protein